MFSGVGVEARGGEREAAPIMATPNPFGSFDDSDPDDLRNEAAPPNPFENPGHSSRGAEDNPGTPVFAARTRSSLIAELDLQDLSDEDEDESDEEAFLKSSLAARRDLKQVAWSIEDDEEVEEISLRVLSELQPGELDGAAASQPAMGAERMGSIFSHGKVPANQDLLGLGTIDFRNAALVRDGSPLGLVRHGSFHKRTGVGRTWSNSLGNKKMAMAPRLSALGHGPSKEDLALLASSDAFDPKTYLGKVHRDSSQEDLKKGQLHLTKQLNEGKDQRMLLVKENFERFIKCKNTIDDIHSKLQHNEFHSSSEAASTVLLMQSLKDVKDKSNTIFRPLIDRQQEREKLQRLLSTFRRYQWFLEMPATLEDHLENRKNDKVVSCYKSSKLFMEEHPNVSLFVEVFHEIERVITGYKDKLYRSLESCKVDVERAKELIATLMRLQGNQVLAQNLQKQNPFLVYLESVGDYVLRKMGDHFSDYKASLQDLERQEEQGEAGKEALSPLEGILLNVVLFAKDNRRRPQLKLFLEYESAECSELSYKHKAGALQGSYAARLSSVLLTVLDILMHLYLEEQSMLSTLRTRNDIHRNDLSEIVGQAETKLHLVFDAYESQLHTLFTLLEDSSGLWHYANEISAATFSVLDEITDRNIPNQDLAKIHDLGMGLVERFVKLVCRQLETVCTFTAQDVKAGVVRARRVHEEKSASLSVLYVGDALLVGLSKVAESMSLVQYNRDTAYRYDRLVELVEISLNNCFHSCATQLDKVGEEVMEKSRAGDYKSDIKRVLQGLQDAHFLENQVFPEVSKLLGSLAKPGTRRRNSHQLSPLIECMHSLKKRYVVLNGVRTQLLQRTYLNGSTEPRSASSNLFEIRNHVFTVLQFFVDQHSHGWQAVPHLCKELLTLLVESFFDTLSKGIHETVSKIGKEEYLQSVLEISYLEKALGLYVSPKAHKNSEQIRRHLFSRCRTQVESSLIDAQLNDALESTKLHWLCFS